MPQGIRKGKLQQKDFTMTSSSSLVCLGKYCMIKGKSLRTISSNILHNSVTSKEFELHILPSDQWPNREDESIHNQYAENIS